MVAIEPQLTQIAVMEARHPTITTGFYISFGLWFTAFRYGGSGFYAVLLGPVVSVSLTLAVFVIFAIVVSFSFRRSIKSTLLFWRDLTVLGGTLLLLDLVWRFYLSPFQWDFYKLANFALDAATPLLVALGLLAIKTESRRRSGASPR